MPIIGPANMFFTRRSLAVLTGGLALAAAYIWFRKRQRSLKYSQRNKKMEETTRWEESSDAPNDSISSGLEEVLKIGEGEAKESSRVGSAASVKSDSLPPQLKDGSSDDGGSLLDLKDEMCQKEEILVDMSEEAVKETLFHWNELEKETENMCTVALNQENSGGSSSSSGEHNSDSVLNSGFRPVNTPSSEGSLDSGRATGGLASSLSPADDAQVSPEIRPIYEFEIPNTLVGLIIGIKGKTIKELCHRTDVKMVIRPHHTPGKMETHQICAVEGPRDNINKCLRMMRRRFPVNRFPELNLRPVLPPPFPDPPSALFGARPMQLTLPEGERCQVFCSSIIDVGHFFLQQLTHPSYASLQRLDFYMFGVYMQPAGVPDIPKPVEAGKLCVAPAFDSWYRAVTIEYYQDEDEVLVKYVDYGGYSRLPRSDLRQIRTDFMTLPFQATECYLAHVEPVDGTTTWSEEATTLFRNLVENRVLECYVVGYHIEDQRAVVELFSTDENNRVERIDSALLDAGLAKTSDPSKVKPVLPKLVAPTNPSIAQHLGNELCAAD